MTTYAYAFEARSIQNYVFAGGKLRDIVAASNLVDQLTDQILLTTLDELGITDDIRFSRRAGGAFYAISNNETSIKNLASVWPLVVNGFAPNLEILTSLNHGENDYLAVRAALAELKIKRNYPAPQLPTIPPIAQRAQRTGGGAIFGKYSINGDTTEIVDLATEQKRKFAIHGLEGNTLKDNLAEKFTPHGTTLVWPTALTAEDGIKAEKVLPLDDNRFMAVIHIDGNGLGQLLIALSEIASRASEDYSKLYLSFSEAITQATQTAAREAVDKVLAPASNATVAARPLILGGDDLTIIVAASKAMEFSIAFINAFESHSAEKLESLKQQFSHHSSLCNALPKKLTACGGIAFVKSSYPFSSAAKLAEELCQRSKQASEHRSDKAQPKPSSLSWHKVTTSSIATADAIYNKELATEVSGKSMTLSLGAYAVNEASGHLPKLTQLLNTVNFVKQAKKTGKLRKYAGELKTVPHQAQMLIERMEETDHSFIHEMSGQLKKLWQAKSGSVSYGIEFMFEDYAVSPLLDIVSLATLSDEKEQIDAN
ncbi:hypothetical protein OPS25_13950 [Alteromonas ponticola]|uniref:Cas10/Cmr2 second palm domain-containing protein n=1 Tax=Alteromonas aquimaris TaxID=2998417 RepID=A0ABT3PA31_9ALTE|nr:hypothetical protein [Alteromonas aquimaris]MCW8109608.1 hypothetical protein [Alteromonas aquimaris]